jgi:hypothetical protein
LCLFQLPDCLFYHNGRKIQDVSLLPEGSFVDVVLSLPGGKGGFGAMLRALGSQISKTTNKEACRDLSGRRLRDINEEDRLKKYVANESVREEEAAEKKKAKLNKLRRIAKGENKHVFHDPKYVKEREESTDKVHDAMEKAFETAAKAKEPQPSTSGLKRKAEEEKPAVAAVKPKKGLWMGDGLTESDLEDSSDEEEEEKKKTAASSNDKKAVAAV